MGALESEAGTTPCAFSEKGAVCSFVCVCAYVFRSFVHGLILVSHHLDPLPEQWKNVD